MFASKTLIAAAILVVGTIGAEADEKTGFVICNTKSPTTNVRSGAGAKEFKILDTLPNGTKVTVIETGENLEGFLWHNVRYENRSTKEMRTGWVYSEAIANECTDSSNAPATGRGTEANESTSGSSRTRPSRRADDNDIAEFNRVFASKDSLNSNLSSFDVAELAQSNMVFGLRLGAKMPSTSSTVIRSSGTSQCQGATRSRYTVGFDKSDPQTKNGNFDKYVTITTYNDIISEIRIVMPPVVYPQAHEDTYHYYYTGSEYQNYGDSLSQRYGQPVDVKWATGDLGKRVGQPVFTGKAFWFLPYSTGYKFQVTSGRYDTQPALVYAKAYIRARYRKSDEIVFNFNEGSAKLGELFEQCGNNERAEMISGILSKFFTPLPGSGSSSAGGDRSSGGYYCRASSSDYIIAQKNPWGESHGRATYQEAREAALSNCRSSGGKNCQIELANCGRK